MYVFILLKYKQATTTVCGFLGGMSMLYNVISRSRRHYNLQVTHVACTFLNKSALTFTLDMNPGLLNKSPVFV